MTSQQLKEHGQRENSFKCMIRGASLTSPYTQLNTLSLPPVAPVFPLQSQSYHNKLPSNRWSYSAEILSTHRSCTIGTTNHTKMHDKLAGILLESYQPTDATQLGYRPYKEK